MMITTELFFNRGTLAGGTAEVVVNDLHLAAIKDEFTRHKYRETSNTCLFCYRLLVVNRQIKLVVNKCSILELFGGRLQQF
ncbi:hypothetical protein HanRHA438_Chr17g0807211 [Helianthus annuus]|nr:hypothetical protein HanHA89_Chr17g0701531 [Helianthus annuus]KAJ0632002.1 hypothetical protein HanLR1_Chr17g0660201 [Helianthus annuus]KAJ0825804.1 hypothetical protein HanRHA438_Chr17g0807211 [Helianthus annuus]